MLASFFICLITILQYLGWKGLAKNFEFFANSLNYSLYIMYGGITIFLLFLIIGIVKFIFKK